MLRFLLNSALRSQAFNNECYVTNEHQHKISIEIQYISFYHFIFRTVQIKSSYLNRDSEQKTLTNLFIYLRIDFFKISIVAGELKKANSKTINKLSYERETEFVNNKFDIDFSCSCTFRAWNETCSKHMPYETAWNCRATIINGIPIKQNCILTACSIFSFKLTCTMVGAITPKAQLSVMQQCCLYIIYIYMWAIELWLKKFVWMPASMGYKCV